MRCPFCLHEETKVIDSRESADAVRRRRECLRCGERFTTYERVEMAGVSVIKKDGRRETFDRGKIVAGLLKACEKRPIARETIERIADEIGMALLHREGKEVPSTEIGALVMERLKALDNVAYIRFASVYRAFEDIESFEAELAELKRRRSEEQGRADGEGSV